MNARCTTVAQCVKLNVFEERIGDVIDENRKIPEHLARFADLRPTVFCCV